MSADDQHTERQRLILEASRAVDAVREQYASREPNWDALHDAIPIEHCVGFMWMSRVLWKAEVIEVYKHGITRRSLHLDHSGHAYRYRRGRYAKIPVGVAVELVFIGIEEQGWTRETPYTEEFQREKYRRLREEGWTIIT